VPETAGRILGARTPGFWPSPQPRAEDNVGSWPFLPPTEPLFPGFQHHRPPSPLSQLINKPPRTDPVREVELSRSNPITGIY
jgi:hypothetical protein